MHTDYTYERRTGSEYDKNAFAYVDYLRLRWRLMISASVTAAVLAFGFSLLLPKRYTATASIVIEPPAGNDVRTSTAVSPVYLESLRTYERFASSDTLFAGAVEHFHLAAEQNPRSIESLKQQVLKVTKVRDTKILEVSATLSDPELAQKLARYVAEETVKLSRVESMAADREMIGEAERLAGESQHKFAAAQKAWAANASRGSGVALEAQIESDVDLAGKTRQSLIDARSDIAEYQANSTLTRELPGLRARAAELQERAAELEKGIERKNRLAAQAAAYRQAFEIEMKMAQTASESSAARLRELQATAGTRGERLRVIDPGIVPQRPSSPNIPLNVFAALFMTLMAILAWLTVSFSYRRRRTE